MDKRHTLFSISLALIMVLLSAFSLSNAGASTNLAQVETPISPLSTPYAPGQAYPTPNPTLVKDWRAPLYPVPWGLTKFDHFFFHRPIGIDEIDTPLKFYSYGAIDFGKEIPHTGLDYPVQPGTEVYAAGPGIVVKAGYGVYAGIENDTDPYGIAVLIRHDFGYMNQNLYTVYAHLSETLIEEGAHVNTGDLIGLSGNTGMSSGPHLHFEVRLGEKYMFSTRNPELWMAPPEDHGVVAGRLTTSTGEMLIEQSVKLTHLPTGQYWVVKSYGMAHTVNSDDYYKENFVRSNLPAGPYEVRVPYEGITYTKLITIHPGAVTYFRFQGRYAFTVDEPYLRLPENIPYPLDN